MNGPLTSYMEIIVISQGHSGGPGHNHLPADTVSMMEAPKLFVFLLSRKAVVG